MTDAPFEMTEILGTIYLIGVVVIFVLGLFLNEKIEGRVATGEPDISSSILMAIMWPVLIVLCVMIALILYFGKETPNE